MLKQKILQIWKEIESLSFQEKLFICSTFVCVFCIPIESGISRAASNSIFISIFTAKFLPYSWVATIPINLVLVSLYNRYLQLFGCLKIFLITISSIVIINCLCGFFILKSPLLAFIHSVWREIYVLLLFQQMWSTVHAVISVNRAKYLYGLIFAFGSLGAIMGGIIPGLLAVKIGTESLFFTSVPSCILMATSYFYMLKAGGWNENNLNEKNPEQSKSSLWKGFILIKNSRFLFFILLFVALLQIGSSLINYLFNITLEQNFPILDHRTEFYGKINAIINAASLALQFVGSFLLLQIMGSKNASLFVGIILLLNSALLFVFPMFGVISYVFICIRSIERSIFGVIKEMLYVPMDMSEKFHAKAFIDIFGYRTSRALGSSLIIFLQYVSLFFSNINLLTMACILVFIGTWFGIIPLLFQYYNRYLDEKQKA